MSFLDIFRKPSISSLEARMDRLEHSFKLLSTEWNEIYDKMAHAAERNRKRRKIEILEPEVAEGSNGDPMSKAVQDAIKMGLLRGY